MPQFICFVVCVGSQVYCPLSETIHKLLEFCAVLKPAACRIPTHHGHPVTIPKAWNTYPANTGLSQKVVKILLPKNYLFNAT